MEIKRLKHRAKTQLQYLDAGEVFDWMNIIAMKLPERANGVQADWGFCFCVSLGNGNLLQLKGDTVVYCIKGAFVEEPPEGEPDEDRKDV
jgi:hypothetical protein